jgi:hypothetical protein
VGQQMKRMERMGSVTSPSISSNSLGRTRRLAQGAHVGAPLPVHPPTLLLLLPLGAEFLRHVDQGGLALGGDRLLLVATPIIAVVLGLRTVRRSQG